MISRVNGRTKLAGVIGWPISHTLSPAMHNAAYEAMGLNWLYVPLPVHDLSDLPRVVDGVRALPFVGFNVTMPYKSPILALLDEVALFARLAGAVNSVQCVDGRLIGYNTDGRGLLESLAEEGGFAPEGRKVVLIGAGGAAGGAFVAFVLAKAARVTVVNRDTSRAEALLGRTAEHMRDTEAAAVPLGPEAEAAVREADLVVNATPLGMKEGDESPIPVEWLHEGQVVADMVYEPAETPFLAGARGAGATAVGGLGMLVAQGATAIETWHEAHVKAPRDVMRTAAEEALAQMPAMPLPGETG